jgi:4-hydroxythreonine-4-phosphate dehydrogenase
LCARLLEKNFPARLVILGDRGLIEARAAALGTPVSFVDYQPETPPEPGHLEVLHIPLAVPALPGKLDIANGPYVLALLDRALAGCTSEKFASEFAAMVTAPVHKGVIADSGVPFIGHTEYLAEKTHTPRVVMLLAGGGLRVALATTHLPLKDVAAAITPEDLEITLRIMHRDFIRKFGIAEPRILVAGLNPHAGEGGHLGREEIEVITPVLEKLRAEGMKLIGPLPADTLFTPPQLARGDGVLAMYHDQGLAVLKYASFGGGVNITLGLPIVRTSVDHGTALDLAGTGKADPGSLFTAIESAVDICARSTEAKT